MCAILYREWACIFFIYTKKNTISVHSSINLQVKIDSKSFQFLYGLPMVTSKLLFVIHYFHNAWLYGILMFAISLISMHRAMMWLKNISYPEKIGSFNWVGKNVQCHINKCMHPKIKFEERSKWIILFALKQEHIFNHLFSNSHNKQFRKRS